VKALAGFAILADAGTAAAEVWTREKYAKHAME